MCKKSTHAIAIAMTLLLRTQSSARLSFGMMSVEIEDIASR